MTDPVSPNLPAYNELPVVDGAPPGSSWGVWGADDRLGSLNLLTPDRVAAGIAAVREHRVFPLDIPLSEPSPPLFGRRPFEHVVTETPSGHDEYLSSWFPQGGSQWDGFRHVRHPKFGFYNGIADEDHSLSVWAEHGIVGRAVLVDVARSREERGAPIDCARPDSITPADLSDALERFSIEVQPGDILLIRTGWMSWYRTLSAERRMDLATAGVSQTHAPGLRPGRDMAEFLWDLHPAAIAADNPSVESWPRAWPLDPDATAEVLRDPERCESVFLHVSLLPLLGIPLGELWDLDALAEHCHASQRYECLFVATPLRLPGGVGSSANAVAIC
jgi:kynurenine formamidase